MKKKLYKYLINRFKYYKNYFGFFLILGVPTIVVELILLCLGELNFETFLLFTGVQSYIIIWVLFVSILITLSWIRDKGEDDE